MRFSLSCSVLLGAFALVASAAESPKRLIQVAPEVKFWVSEEQLEEVVRAHELTNKISVGYFDITDFQDTPKVKQVWTSQNYPAGPVHQDIVRPLFGQISTENMRKEITTLSSFHSRYYTTPTAVEAAHYLHGLMQSWVDASGRSDAGCTLFNHSWAQPSVVCRIDGSGSLADELVIVGAHFDSINSRGGPSSRAPGADDDLSGVASFVEAFRILVQSGFKPKRTIEFMGYAAEEVGLRGSQDLARTYKNQGKKIYAVYQNEMSGYPGSKPSIKILQDYVNLPLTKFVESLVNEYCAIPFEAALCGYACSDHASWDKEGFPAVCTAEAGPFGEVSPYMHTDKDTVDKLDFKFTLEFAKLCLAFILELAL